MKGTTTGRGRGRDFKDTDTNGTFESKGTIGSGTMVGESSGTKTSTTVQTVGEEWTVVGKTSTENPLVPGEPEFGKAPVAIVEKVTYTTGTTEVVEKTVEERPQGARHEFETRTLTHADQETAASTYGLAGDEYVVRISDLDLLWDPDLDGTWDETGTTLKGVDVLVMSDVAVGDFWVSPDGGTLYKAVSRERVPLTGGGSKVAVKVELRKVENAKDGLVGRCLVIPEDDVASQWTTYGEPGGGEGQTASRKVHLNPGCQGQFAHYTVGTQWWAENVLVREDTTTFKVEIKDWGFEWIDWSGNRTRRTAQALDPNAIPDGTSLFVEYTYTETHRVFAAELVNKTDTPWSD